MPRKVIQRWTYGANPADSTIDAVRFLVGDTDPSDKLLDDCEISWLLEQEGDPLSAAICAALGLAAIFAREFDGSFKGGRSGKPFDYFSQLAKDLQTKRSRRKAVAPYVGGLSLAEKDANNSDPDLVRAEFRRDMMKSPGTDPAAEDQLNNSNGV